MALSLFITSTHRNGQEFVSAIVFGDRAWQVMDFTIVAALELVAGMKIYT